MSTTNGKIDFLLYVGLVLLMASLAAVLETGKFF